LYNFTLIKLCAFLITGILIGFYWDLEFHFLLLLGAALAILFLIIFLYSLRKFHQNSLFGIISYFLFLYLGILSAQLHFPENNPDHLSNYLNELDENSKQVLIGEIIEELKPDLYHTKYILRTLKLNKIPAEGKVLVLLNKDSIRSTIKIGQHLALASEIKNIPSNLNPYQFDYGNYMRNLGVTHQVLLKKENLVLLGSPSNSIRSYAGKLREKIISSLKQQDFEKDELAVIQSLLLGQRQELSKELQQNYAEAGIIHILAVSGLHVGIILLLLNWCLKILDRSKYGRFLKIIILLVCLWGFALLAGLSPSVVRAVSMFSFVAIGLQLKKRTSTLNTLFASLFILLLGNPYYLFQAGFQLSYLAVFSIVILQPTFSSLYTPKNKITGSLWKLITVSIAAQIGVLPLSLYYFHQFPGLFLLSNIIVLPFMGIILGLGIVLILINLTGITPYFLPQFYGELISLLNKFVEFIAGLKMFVIHDISFSIALCLGMYLCYLFFIPLVKKISYTNLSLALIAILIFQSVLITEEFSKTKNEFIVFHGNRRTDIAVLNPKNLMYYSSNPDAKPTYLKNYELQKKRVANTLNSRNVFRFSEKKILLIDSIGTYRIPNFEPHILVLTNSPKINLDRVLKDLHPELIIADGSNYKSYIKRWKITLAHKKIPFHITGEKGAFNINHQYKY